ncbi:MAG: hypothetical protein K2X27_13100, partial [Candidatus Obscuribacterales bacterium]|nr:hypothetical protein [Candidatus Obscuribacterales bacterium]
MHTANPPQENCQEAKTAPSGNSEQSKLLGLLCSPWLSVALIVLLSALSFGRSLGSYFLADDIGEVRYVHEIFNGRWDLFWSNFCGNYMQVPNMSVYRPMLLLSLVFDYLLWKGNALGYYLSNLIYFSGAAALLCILLRKLCAGFGKARAAAVGFSAAVLFTCNPLHCESISWVVGRVDTACCMFYLAALCLFVSRSQAKQKQYLALTAAGLFAFVLAICTKEMAIGFAPVVAAIAFFFPQTESADFKARLATAWQSSRPAWIATAIYFLVRFLSLGTLLGGYNGSVGASQSANALTKWMDLDNWHRLFFPIPLDLYQGVAWQEQAMATTYTVLAFLLFLRLISGSMPWRHCAFLLFWALTQVAPIYRLWGLGFNLEGARFCFFLTLSLSSALPIIFFAPDKKIPKAISLK